MGATRGRGCEAEVGGEKEGDDVVLACLCLLVVEEREGRSDAFEGCDVLSSM